MKVSATHRNARIAPRKVRPLARLLTGMPVSAAELQLKYLPGRAVRDTVLAVLKSAIANAQHNHGLEAKDLTVSEMVVNGGFAFKRFRPASRGMAHPFVKRTSHITITLTAAEEKKEKSKKKAKAEIVTISADQYAAEALDNDQQEKRETTAAAEDKTPLEIDVPKSKEQEAFGKMRGLQSGGDKKKSFRRKSVG
ncbi:MAG: 50S ribosomal protein L22 [Patescibacteria group bacterium]